VRDDASHREPAEPLLDPETVRRTLSVALATGARFAEVFAETRAHTSVRLDDGRIEEVVSGADRGAGIRVVHGDAQAYAFSNRLDAASLREAAEAAAGAVRSAGAESQPTMDLRAGPPLRTAVEQPTADVPRERKVAWLREADDAARGHDPAVRQVIAFYADSLQRVLIANSDGLWVEEERPRIRLGVQVVAARDGTFETGFKGPGGLAGAELLTRHPPSEIAGEAARMAVTMLDGRPAPAGELPVVVGAGSGGVLFHEACGHGLEVDHIHKGASIYTGRVGEMLASPLVTGTDDGTVAGAWGSAFVDDEGTPTRRTVLFDEGRLTGYLYARVEADHDGVASTGNGRRQSYAHLPIPRMTNSYIEAGRDRVEDLIASTPRGLYAKTLGGGQVNPATGDFVFGVMEAYLIEDGRVTAPVRGANLIGNGITVLSFVDAVSDDFDTSDGVCGKEGQSAPVSLGSPTLRISRMTVGGTDA
jgi:TldD protein